MIKFLKYKIITIIGLLFILASCSDGEERNRTLNTDRDKVTVSHEAQTETVGVEVDKGMKFVALWDGGSWGKVEVVDGAVKIILAANTTEFKRDGSVEVRLDNGWRTRLIKVTQNGEPLLNVVPDQISFDFMGGTQTIKVESEIAWSVKSSVDWVSVEPHNLAGEIVITISENTVTTIRQTNITIIVKGKSKDVLVEQEAALSSMLPYLNFNTPSIEELIEFEEARHSVLIKASSPMSPHRVFTKSSLSPTILYSMMGGNTYVIGSVLYDTEKFPDFFQKEEFKDFLINNEFEYLYVDSGGKHIFWLDLGEGVTYHCQATVIPSTAKILYERKTDKPNPDAPTFATFPYMPDEITFGSAQGVVKTWEAANDGTMTKDDEDLLTFDVAPGTDFHSRYYSYKGVRTDLIEVNYLFHDPDKLLLKSGTGYIVNPRFVKLLAKEGFVKTTGAINEARQTHVAKGINVVIDLAQIIGDPTLKMYGILTFSKYTPPASGVSERARFYDYKSNSSVLTPLRVSLIDN